MIVLRSSECETAHAERSAISSTPALSVNSGCWTRSWWRWAAAGRAAGAPRRPTEFRALSWGVKEPCPEPERTQNVHDLRPSCLFTDGCPTLTNPWKTAPWPVAGRFGSIPSTQDDPP